MRTWLRMAVLGAVITTGCGRVPPSVHGTGSNAAAENTATEAAAVDDASSPSDPSESASESASSPAGAGAADDEETAKAKAEREARAAEARVVSEALAADPGDSTSVGSPTRGHLEGSLALPLRAPGLLFLPSKDPDSRYGTVELVQGLLRAAQAVEQAESGAPVTVGDLAREEGGDISGHASHRSGRDVDVLFYLLREDGQPFLPSKFIPLDPQGNGTDYGDLADPSDDVPVHLDVARTWRFVAALLAEEATAVQKILIVEHLRSRLLEEAQRVDAPEEIVQRFSEVTCQPRFPHDDHMHIRVFCSAQDIGAGCEDTRPIFPWRKQMLAEIGVAPVRVGQGPASTSKAKAKSKSRPKLKTVAQARAEAGPMHEDVVEFLDRREAWVRKPHPGRRWCR